MIEIDPAARAYLAKIGKRGGESTTSRMTPEQLRRRASKAGLASGRAGRRAARRDRRPAST